MKFGTLFVNGLVALGGIARGLGQQIWQHNHGMGQFGFGQQMQQHNHAMGQFGAINDNDPNGQLCLSIGTDICITKAISNLRGSLHHFDGFGVSGKLKDSIAYLEKYVGYSSLAPEKSKSFVHLALAQLYWTTHDYRRSYEHQEIAIGQNPKLSKLKGSIGIGQLDVIDLLEQAKHTHFDDLLGFKPKLAKNHPINLLKKAAEEISKHGHPTKTAKTYLKQAVAADSSLKDIAARVRKGELLEEEIDTAIEENNGNQLNPRAYMR